MRHLEKQAQTLERIEQQIAELTGALSTDGFHQRNRHEGEAEVSCIARPSASTPHTEAVCILKEGS
jgi:hypothetical protein